MLYRQIRIELGCMYHVAMSISSHLALFDVEINALWTSFYFDGCPMLDGVERFV